MYSCKQLYFKKEGGSQINNLDLYLMELEKQGQIKPKPNRRKKITKVRAELNEVENRKTIESTKSKLLAKLTYQKWEKIWMIKSEVISGVNTNNLPDLKCRQYYQPYRLKIIICEYHKNIR